MVLVGFGERVKINGMLLLPVSLEAYALAGQFLLFFQSPAQMAPRAGDHLQHFHGQPLLCPSWKFLCLSISPSNKTMRSVRLKHKASLWSRHKEGTQYAFAR